MEKEEKEWKKRDWTQVAICAWCNRPILHGEQHRREKDITKGVVYFHQMCHYEYLGCKVTVVDRGTIRIQMPGDR